MTACNATACNARPPEGHPFHGTGVACHLASDHIDFEPHAWDIGAAAERHEVLTHALAALRDRFPDRNIARLDAHLPHPLYAYDVDEHGRRADRPYRTYDTPAGPWILVTYVDGGEFAIWRTTGAIFAVGPDGAVGEEPFYEPKGDT